MIFVEFSSGAFVYLLLDSAEVFVYDSVVTGVGIPVNDLVVPLAVVTEK